MNIDHLENKLFSNRITTSVLGAPTLQKLAKVTTQTVRQIGRNLPAAQTSMFQFKRKRLPAAMDIPKSKLPKPLHKFIPKA